MFFDKEILTARYWCLLQEAQNISDAAGKCEGLPNTRDLQVLHRISRFDFRRFLMRHTNCIQNVQEASDFISAKTEGEIHVMSGVRQPYKRVPAFLSAKSKKIKNISPCMKSDYILVFSGEQETTFWYSYYQEQSWRIFLFCFVCLCLLIFVLLILWAVGDYG